MLDSYDTALTPPISLGRAVRYIATYKSDLFLSAQHFALCSFAVAREMMRSNHASGYLSTPVEN
jgi:hypothetical protein